MKKTGLVVVLLVVLVMNCIGCDKEEPLPQVSVESRRQEAKAAEKAAQAQAKAEEENKRLSRSHMIGQISSSFKETDEPEWKRELQGKGNFHRARELSSRYQSQRLLAMNVENRDFEPVIYWDNIGITADQADLIHKKTGLATAKAMLESLQVPLVDRLDQGSCLPGEGGYNFYETPAMVAGIAEILTDIGAAPKDIGTTSAKLRQMVLTDIKAYIKYMRNEIASLRASESDGGGLLIWMASRGKDWGFSQKELGLTEKETQALK